MKCGVCCQALALRSDLLLTGASSQKGYRSKQLLGGEKVFMEGFTTPNSKRNQATFDAGLNSADEEGWDFLVGTAISVYQNSGGDNNNWWRYERQRTRFGRPTIDVSAPLSVFFSTLSQISPSLVWTRAEIPCSGPPLKFCQHTKLCGRRVL